MKKYTLLICILFIVVIVFLGQPLTTKKQSICLDYKSTRANLIAYSFAYYPEIKATMELKKSGFTVESTGELVKKEDIKDLWNNPFKLSKDSDFVYSFGKNSIDENGMGDDIRIHVQENMNLYCEDK